MKINIALNIRYHRQRLGMTQKELATKLHKTESAVRMWELEKNEPTLQATVQMADIFNVTIDELVGRKGSF